MRLTFKTHSIAAGTVLALAATGLGSCADANAPSARQEIASGQQTSSAANIEFYAPFTSDPFSMLQRYGTPKLTPPAQAYWDVFTPDLDPAIQCLPANLARELFSPAGLYIYEQEDRNLTLSFETIYMDGREFPETYAMENRSEWPVQDYGYSIGHWENGTLKIETRGVIERDILIGHIPILPSAEMIIKRSFKLIAVDQRWEALGLAPQEANDYLVPDASAKTLEMDMWLDDPKTLLEPWHTVKQYREVTSPAYVASGGDLPVTEDGGVSWEGTDAAAQSGVPAEFLENYDGGCVLFPEYDETGASDLEIYIPK